MCSTVAAEGLDLPTNLLPLVVGNDAAMADMILRLHQDRSLNDHLSRQVTDFARRLLAEEAVDAAMANAIGRPS